MTPHLSEDQFGELLAGSSTSANPHLLTCDQCSAELASVRESLSLFRDATRSYADNELRSLPQMTLPSRRFVSPALQPAWWLAAATLMLAALSPIQMQRQHAYHANALIAGAATTTATASTQSDEALLEDIDRETSASLPASMQALADPSTSLDPSTPLAVQRKD
jgi:anti-sigma factor RsiW